MKDKLGIVSKIIISLVLFILLFIFVSMIYGEDTIYKRDDENGNVHIFETKGDIGLYFFDGNVTDVDGGYVLNGTLYQEQQSKGADEEENKTFTIIIFVIMVVMVGIVLAYIMKKTRRYEDSIMCCEEVIKQCESEEE